MTPDVVEFDKTKMTKPVFDLILGCKTMKELGIVLDVQTKEITIDHVILPMRDINSLTSQSLDKAWAVNNSMAHILDANYEKADHQSVVSTNCSHLSLQTKTSYWSCSKSLGNFLMEH